MEDIFRYDVLNKLSPYFNCITEEKFHGIHPVNNKKMRVDAMIWPKDNSKWANKEIIFGIEFKDPNKLDKRKDYDTFMKQCIDYSYCTWFFHGENKSKFDVPILLCPSISNDDRYNRLKEDIYIRAMMKFLNHFNIGELALNTYRSDIEIRFSCTHLIWNSDEGVNEGKRWKFKTKFGGER